MRSGESGFSAIAILTICVAVDLADFLIGWVFGLSLLADILQTVVAVWLFGPLGLVALWELATPIDQVDGFVPTLTILAVTQLRRRAPNRPRSLS
ncbi:MAG: hypothetical protein GC152_06555 [Alphaproteobacteria bacterium]|nr:hypothetical protein [Alphaproteobacteria bacterium]